MRLLEEAIVEQLTQHREPTRAPNGLRSRFRLAVSSRRFHGLASSASSRRRGRRCLAVRVLGVRFAILRASAKDQLDYAELNRFRLEGVDRWCELRQLPLDFVEILDHRVSISANRANYYSTPKGIHYFCDVRRL